MKQIGESENFEKRNELLKRYLRANRGKKELKTTVCQ